MQRKMNKLWRYLLQRLRRSPRPVWVRTVGTSEELAPYIQMLWPGEDLGGKLQFASGYYRLPTRESAVAFIKSRKIGYQYYPAETPEDAYWHRCTHYGVDFVGQFHHDKDWTGAAIGTVHFLPAQGGNHVIGFIFYGDPLGLLFWEISDQTYRNSKTVVGRPLHAFRAP